MILNLEQETENDLTFSEYVLTTIGGVLPEDTLKEITKKAQKINES